MSMATKAATVLLGVVIAASTCIPAQAAVVIGGTTFQDDAFADSIVSFAGTYTTSTGTLLGSLADKSPETFAFSFTPGALIQFSFDHSQLINGPGTDLALFDLFGAGVAPVTIAGVTIAYTSVPVGTVDLGVQLNESLIDLSDFGIEAGAVMDRITVAMDAIKANGGKLNLSLVASTYSPVPLPPFEVPEPGSILLLIAGLAGSSLLRWLRLTGLLALANTVATSWLIGAPILLVDGPAYRFTVTVMDGYGGGMSFPDPRDVRLR